MTDHDDARIAVRYAVAGPVATLILDSPHNRNAISRRAAAELVGGLARAIADDAVRVVLLTHTGPAFCSGVDLTETAASRGDELPAAALVEVLHALWDCPLPVLARVGGAARAGGLGLLGACDLVLVADDVTFAFTEVRLGVVPAVISATVLPRLAPRAAAALYLTGEVFDARRAVEIGLVTAAVPAADLDAEVDRHLAMLARGGPSALIGTKALLRRRPAADLRTELAELSALSLGYFDSAEGREGVAAYRERRDPSWVVTD